MHQHQQECDWIVDFDSDFWNYDVIKWDEYNRKNDHIQKNRFNRHREMILTYHNDTIETITKTRIGQQTMWQQV